MNGNNLSFPLRVERLPWLLGAGVFFARLVLLLQMPLEGIRGYGDFMHYYLVSGLPGWPFIHYWVEYPPVFPFLSALLYRAAGGQEHVFDYLLALLLLLADTGSAVLFARLALRLHAPERAALRSTVYVIVLVALSYSWWYFDPLVVFAMLLGLALILEGRAARAGLAIALGIAIKFFPGLALLAAWRRFSWKRLALLVAVSLLPLLVSFALLWLQSPEYTRASILAQGSKGSWETVWALLDGNIRTGSFGGLQERLDPNRAVQPIGNPPVIPTWASLVVFAGIGLFLLLRVKPAEDPRAMDRQSIALVGFAWGLFALWSPGWSPQWVLNLLPLILLALPERQAVLLSVVLIMVNLLEWPVLLSRGYFDGLWLTILLRAMLLLVMTIAFYPFAVGASEQRKSPKPVGNAAQDGII